MDFIYTVEKSENIFLSGQVEDVFNASNESLWLYTNSLISIKVSILLIASLQDTWIFLSSENYPETNELSLSSAIESTVFKSSTLNESIEIISLYIESIYSLYVKYCLFKSIISIVSLI